jgi:LPXTG-site transpeptidase (sortase) family protein
MFKRFIFIGYSLLLAVSSLVMATNNGPIKIDPWTSGDAESECNQVECCQNTKSHYKIECKDDDSVGYGFCDGYTGDEYLYEDNKINITVTDSNDDDQATHFDWESTVSISCVIVVGGNSANVYCYDPEVKSGNSLTTPINSSSGKNFAISHVTFCWGEPEVSPTPTSTPTNTPTQTPTSTPTQTPTNTLTQTPTSTPTQTPTETPTSTNTPTSTPTQTPEPTNTPEPDATSTPEPTATSEPADTPPPATVIPTDTQTPTDTPQPARGGQILEGISTEEEVLGVADNRNPLLGGIKAAYQKILGEKTDLPKTGSNQEIKEKLPSDNQATNEKLIIPSQDFNREVYQGEKLGSQWLIGHQEVLKTDFGGNTVYYGHNSTEIFGNLGQLAVGDQIVVAEENQMQFYQVNEIARVASTYIETLENSQLNTITLLTCDNWDENLRLVVKAVKK